MLESSKKGLTNIIDSLLGQAVQSPLMPTQDWQEFDFTFVAFQQGGQFIFFVLQF